MKIFRLAAIAAFAAMANSAAHASGIPTADVLVATLMEQQAMKDAAHWAQYTEDKLKELETAYNSYMNLYQQTQMLQQNMNFNGFSLESPTSVFSAFNQLRSVRNQYLNAYNSLANSVNGAIAAGCQIYGTQMICDSDKVTQEQANKIAADVDAKAAVLKDWNDPNKPGSAAYLLAQQEDKYTELQKKFKEIVDKGEAASDREIMSLLIDTNLTIGKEMHVANQLKLEEENRRQQQQINEGLARGTESKKMKITAGLDGTKKYYSQRTSNQ